MTTLIAIAASYAFYGHQIWWALVVVVLVGLLQMSTKSAMSSQFRKALAHGLPGSAATDAISNRTTHINMVSSFIVYGFGIYAAVVYFL